MCPPVSPHKGVSIVHSPHTMRVYLVWKRRYADVRAGTQAPPLRFRLRELCVDVRPLRSRLGGLRVGRLMSFGQIARGRIACGRLMSFGWIVHDVRACCLGA